MNTDNSKPLVVTDKELAKFNSAIGPAITAAFELAQSRQLSCQKYAAVGHGNLQSYRLVDPSTHGAQVFNQRGNEIDVFPIVSTMGGQIFVGIAFEWVRVGSRHRFSSAQIVTFDAPREQGGQANNVSRHAQQLFRLEWQGPGENGQFEAVVAAHPHWQIDALPTPKLPDLPNPSVVLELQDIIGANAISKKSWLSRIHFAASASGWALDRGWEGDFDNCAAHANAPETINALQTWTISAARYLKHQVGAAVA
jgi:hypothetical protein